MATTSLSDLAEKMRDIDFAVLSTRTEGGALAGRPMSNNREVDFPELVEGLPSFWWT